MKLCCKKSLSTRPFDYTVGEYYILEGIWSYGLETYYRIFDNFEDTHDFDKSELDKFFITISEERKLKLEKLCGL